MGLDCLWTESTEGCCEYGDEHSDSTEGEKFLDSSALLRGIRQLVLTYTP
jgi:hypothetical protein